MRRISKRAVPPRELQGAVAGGAGDWDDPGVSLAKTAIREALVEDQRGLCCYCMQRIRPEPYHPERERSGTKIEHFVAQSSAPGRALDWSDLLAACGGSEGCPHRQQTCDTRKGERPLHHLEPLRSLPELKYKNDGRMVATSSGVNDEIEGVLNLNSDLLVGNRRSALTALQQSLRKTLGSSTWTRQQLLRERQRIQELPTAPPFLGTLEYWLERFARRRQ